METRKEASIIPKSDYQNGSFEYDGQKIIIRNILSKEILNEDRDYKIWQSISNKLFENQINEGIKDYKIRTKLINSVVNNVIENNINGIVIDFNNIQDKDNIQRLLIELAPKLREIGIKTCIVLNENMEENDYKNIVDFIVK